MFEEPSTVQPEQGGEELGTLEQPLPAQDDQLQPGHLEEQAPAQNGQQQEQPDRQQAQQLEWSEQQNGADHQQLQESRLVTPGVKPGDQQPQETRRLLILLHGEKAQDDTVRDAIRRVREDGHKVG
jgi:hypothetical protein